MLTANVRELKRPIEQPLEHVVFEDRVRVSIHKSVRKRTDTKKLYRYYVNVEFVYCGVQVRTTHGYIGMKRAMKFAGDIFRARNAYMTKLNYKLSN